jgi:cell volume regulation protein A
VFTSLAFSNVSIRSKLFISWVGLRGGVPIVFATYPMIAGLDKAGIIFNLVFFISVTSVLLQGTTLPLVARWLRVTEPPAPPGTEYPGTLSVADKLKEIVLDKKSMAAGKKIVALHLPTTIYIIYVGRNDQFIQPAGSFRLLAGDRLFILSSNEEDMEAALEMFSPK